MEKIDSEGKVVRILSAKERRAKARTKFDVASDLKGHSCRHCGKFLSYDSFKDATDPLIDKDGKLSICNDCLDLVFNELNKTYENLYETFFAWCQHVDILYDRDCIVNALDQYENHNQANESITVKYWRAVKVRFKNKSIRYSDAKSAVLGQNSISTSVAKSELAARWGTFNNEEYKFLEEKYEEYTKAFGVSGPNERDGYKTLALLLLKQRSAPDNKDVIAAIKAQYEMLGIDPKQLRKENKDKGGRTLGLEIAFMEQTDPADYYDKPEMYFDHDGLEKDLKELMRAQKNHLTGTRDFQSLDISTEIIDATANDEPLEGE